MAIQLTDRSMTDASAEAPRSRLASSQNPGVIFYRSFRDGSFVDFRPALPPLRGRGVLTVFGE
jgi:hypothetical protein